MLIGVPREIKPQEYRVGLTPESAAELIHRGHAVLVETGAGAGIGADDGTYRAVGAQVAEEAAPIWSHADLVVKVKEPQPGERAQLRTGQVLFTYLHLAPDPEQARDLVASGAVCIAYETVTDPQGGLPLLKPMSQVAGRLSIQAGANALERERGGRGLLLGGVPGVAPAHVVILGGGTVGFNAAQMAVGMQADVTVLDRDSGTLERLSNHFGAAAQVVYSTRHALEGYVSAADLVVGAILIPGAATPKLVTRALLADMSPGAVLVDVSIDQGGCFETSRPTTHGDPTYLVDGIVHYCVANMPGAVPRTSTYALNNAILPRVLALADKGWRQALRDDRHLRDGLNCCAGRITHPAVAAALSYALLPAEQALEAA